MLPDQFAERMEGLLKTEYGAFLDALEQERHQALRLNRLKKNAEGKSAAEVFAPRDKTRSLVPWAKDACYYSSGEQPGKHPFHEAGLYYIQEPSAMAPAEILSPKPGERVLDLCAAPGGKSAQLAAALAGTGLLVCNEIHPARARILSGNLERMGVCNALVTNETPERLARFFPGYFDRILVDAPCSGEGMFRKNPAACEEWSPENVALCARRQDNILHRAAEMLRPGGRLVYSTCTFAPAENEGSVSRFLAGHPDFSLLPIDKSAFGGASCDGVPEWGGETDKRLTGTLRLWPHRIKGEGHFAALMEKEGGREAAVRSCPANGFVKGLPEREAEALFSFCRENLTPFQGSPAEQIAEAVGLKEETVLIRFGDNLYLVPAQTPDLKGLKALRPGLWVGSLKKDRFEPSHALALALWPKFAAHVWDFGTDDAKALSYLNGQTFDAAGEKGWYLICLQGFSLGWGKLAGGIMKNHYPKGLRLPLRPQQSDSPPSP